MSLGKSVKLFLVDGSPNGILTAEIINWTGKILSAPRSKLAELIQRDECKKTGVYFLVSTENESFPLVYIGESDDVANRLKQHNRTEESGGKDFWDKVCLVTSKDQNLTKTHIKYLESRLIQISETNAQCQLLNGTAPSYQNLPESDIADMEFFLEQIQIVLPVLGLTFLKELKHTSKTLNNPSLYEQESALTPSIKSSATPIFELSNPKFNFHAQAQEIDGEFIVFKDSLVRAEVINPEYIYLSNLRPKLFEQGVIDDSSFKFKQDYAFKSPSAAASVITGRPANGRTSWKTVDTKISYAQWQEQQIDNETNQLNNQPELLSTEES